MRLSTGLLLACALLGGAIGLFAPLEAPRAEIAVPSLRARVTDLTSTLSAEQAATLEQKLQAFEARKGSQIAVLIVPTTDDEDIAGFGIRVAEAWKLGRKGVDDGAILIVAKDDHRMRIETGYGLEGVMPDAIAGRIVRDTIAPHFKQSDYYGGINAGVDQMIRVVDGEPLPAPARTDRNWSPPPGGMEWLTTVLVLIIIGGTILRRIFGRTFGALATGGVSGLIAYVLTHLLPAAIGVAVLGFFLAMLFGGFGGPSGWSSRGRSGWGGGWGGGGFGGGMGGGGGFSGGGGGFGGGGASGSW